MVAPVHRAVPARGHRAPARKFIERSDIRHAGLPHDRTTARVDPDSRLRHAGQRHHLLGQLSPAIPLAGSIHRGIRRTGNSSWSRPGRNLPRASPPAVGENHRADSGWPRPAELARQRR